MMNRAAIRKFLLENIPSNPLSSSSMKSASATPSDIQSSGQGRSPSVTPSNLLPSLTSPSPLPTQLADASLEPPMIEVETSPEIDPSQAPISPSHTSPQDPSLNSQKRPRIKNLSPNVAASEGGPAPSSAFPAPVMTPQFNLKAAVSNMLKAVHHAAVNSLASRPVEGLRQLLLSHTAMTPAITVALVERYEKMRRDYEGISLQLKDICSQDETLENKFSDEEAKHHEELHMLKGQLEDKDRVLTMQSIKIESLKTMSFQSYTRGREKGLAEGQASAVAAYKAFPEYA
ncbi:hypothetical protein Salat_2883300 [Sesamum alatum]|uniref:Uncharacterized protein n=1 Tax=Sesamum alatum TaxID=300844 RepID=A0AAE1XJ53_9LAMI|nr:hypothetical protein Salat_2883300 [Sesamum alatum]